jgi:hypothetical protein
MSFSSTSLPVKDGAPARRFWSSTKFTQYWAEADPAAIAMNVRRVMILFVMISISLRGAWNRFAYRVIALTGET